MPSLLLAILASFPSLPRFRPRRVRSGGEDGSSAEDSNGLNHRGRFSHHEDAEGDPPAAIRHPVGAGTRVPCVFDRDFRFGFPNSSRRREPSRFLAPTVHGGSQKAPSSPSQTPSPRVAVNLPP